MTKNLLVIGMHRSGTSAVSGWLHHGGIHMGDDLLAGTQNNVRGHFEDNLILEFHRKISKDRNIHDWKITEETGVIWNDQEKDFLSKFVIDRNNNQKQWGVKEPRLCLYIAEWKSFLPSADYLILYRHYSEVAKSLVNREIRNYLMRYNIKINNDLTNKFSSILKARVRFYINVWKFYNSQILKNVPFESNNYYCLEFKNFNDRKCQLKEWLYEINYKFIESDPEFVNMKLLTSNISIKDSQADIIYNKLRDLEAKQFIKKGI